MISDAVAAPGRIGKSYSAQASNSRCVAPGETPNFAPAALAALTSAGVSKVPAPTTPPSTSDIARIASSAQGVRSVTSSAGNPPATKACAKGAAWARSSITRTGTTGARRQISAALADCSAGGISGSFGPNGGGGGGAAREGGRTVGG